MAQTVAQKLKLEEGAAILLRNAPAAYAGTLKELLPSARLVEKAEASGQIHWFVNDMATLESELPGVLSDLKPGLILWLFFPKGSSSVQTDLNRDSLYASMHGNDNLQFLVLVSFDETWSAFSIRLKNESDKKKAANDEQREVLKYADSASKTIRLPEDLTAAFSQNPRSAAAFEALPFSHKREYLEWIVTAKKPETRAVRIAGTVEKVIAGWKNPRNT